MKLLIAGCRTLTLSSQAIYSILNNGRFRGERLTEIVSGGAKGIDTSAKEFAKYIQLPCKVFAPQWDRFGKKAGFLRNIEMANYADVLLAVWDGESRGTKHMISTMLDKNKPVHVELYR